MIWGASYSKFVSGVTTVELPNSILHPDFIKPDIIEHQSIISGKKNWINKGDYSEFKVQVNLFKYTDPNTTFNLVESYKFAQVTFYPHKDGQPMKDIFGSEIQFMIIKINAYSLRSKLLKDIIIITFRSDRFTQLVPGVYGGYGTGYGLDYGVEL